LQGATYDYGFRIYDARIAKFLSVDPLSKSYPWYTPYQFAGNTPIKFIDLDGLETFDPNMNGGVGLIIKIQPRFWRGIITDTKKFTYFSSNINIQSAKNTEFNSVFRTTFVPGLYNFNIETISWKFKLERKYDVPALNTNLSVEGSITTSVNITTGKWSAIPAITTTNNNTGGGATSGDTPTAEDLESQKANQEAADAAQERAVSQLDNTFGDDEILLQVDDNVGNIQKDVVRMTQDFLKMGHDQGSFGGDVTPENLQTETTELSESIKAFFEEVQIYKENSEGCSNEYGNETSNGSERNHQVEMWNFYEKF